MGVDQARGEQAAGAVDPARRAWYAAGRARRRPRRSGPSSPTTMCPSRVLGAGRVDRGDGAVLDDGLTRRPARRPAVPRPGSSRSRCTGTGCRPAPRGSPRRSGAGCASSRSCTGDDEAGRAEATLDRAGLDERLLHRVAARSAVGRGPPTVTHVAALGLAGGDQAGAHRRAVEVDRAGAALALLAGVLRAGQAEPLAQHVQQALARPHVVGRRRGCAVDGAASRASRPSSQVVVPGPGQRAAGQHGQGVPAVARRCRARRRSGAAAAATSSPNAAQPRVRRRAAARPSRQLAGQELLGLRRPQRRRARPSRCRCRPAAPPGRSATANEQTAITIALRVPTLANCCGPARRPARGTAAISSSGRQRAALDAGKNSADRDQPGAPHATPPRPPRRPPAAAGGVAGRRGRAEVAADRAAVADLRRADRPRRLRQARQRARRARR